jgi:phosphate transport system permease protein
MVSFSKYRILKDKLAQHSMLLITLGTLGLVIFIGTGLYVKSLPILNEHSLWQLITTSEWRPSKNLFGFLPFIAGTLAVTFLSILWTFPVALLTAIYLSENARPQIKKIVYPMLDILAGIPPVIYGVWGILVIVPFISAHLATHFVEYSTGYSVLAGGLVLGVMILPLLISMFVELFSAVPREFREASLSLGATRWQTSKLVIIRKTLPGIIASSVLAISRAFGETMAVIMVCGNMPGIPTSLFEGCYPLPALIANNYGEMLSVPLYESALMFAALTLFVIILIFNAVSRIVLNRIERSIQL